MCIDYQVMISRLLNHASLKIVEHLLVGLLVSQVDPGVFCEKYNLSFHKPKKDQCNKCSAFFHLPNDKKEEDAAEEHKLHIERKERARQEKQAGKERGERDPFFQTFTFDLQQTLQTALSNALT